MVFNLLVFPLLALDATFIFIGMLAGKALTFDGRETAGTAIAVAAIVLIVVVACVAIDLLIIRWVWQAAKTHVGADSESVGCVKRNDENEAGADTGKASGKPVDPRSPSTGGPWQWADTIAMLAGMTWTSPKARWMANASAAGFLGFLACLAFLPGMHWCAGFSGFFGLFGLIGVAYAIEFFARPHRTASKWLGILITVIAIGISVLLPVTLLMVTSGSHTRSKLPTANERGVIDVASHPGGPWIAKLSSGITAELLGVGENKKGDNGRWWRPDGSPLTNRPYKALGGLVSGENSLPREFAVRLGSVPSEPVGTKWQFEPSGSTAGGSQPQAGPQDVRAIAVALPANARTVNVHFGLAAGPWQIVTSGSGGETSGLAGGGGVTFSKPYEKDGDTVIVVSHNLADKEVRIVAVGKDSHIHLPGRTETGSVENMSQISVTFPNISPREIQTFRLEARPYQWVEFRNVALQPKQPGTGKSQWHACRRNNLLRARDSRIGGGSNIAEAAAEWPKGVTTALLSTIRGSPP